MNAHAEAKKSSAIERTSECTRSEESTNKQPNKNRFKRSIHHFKNVYMNLNKNIIELNFLSRSIRCAVCIHIVSLEKVILLFSAFVFFFMQHNFMRLLYAINARDLVRLTVSTICTSTVALRVCVCTLWLLLLY